MLRPQNNDAAGFETGNIDFIFVLLKSGNPQEFNSSLEDLLDTAVDQNATVMQVLSSLVLILTISDSTVSRTCSNDWRAAA